MCEFKGALPDLKQFLATESPLKMMKNNKEDRVNPIFLDKKDRANFKLYDLTAWLTNNSNTHIVQYLEN